MVISSTNVKAKILSTLRKKPMSVSELSRQLKMRREFVSGYLEGMRSEGKVEFVTVGRSKVYKPRK
jgi:DNA-binding transcriptional ArsR family regulator